MAHYLASHPDLFMARKEMHFFGADLDFGPQFYRRGLEAYRQEFGSWNGQRRVGEAPISYLFSRCAAAEIKAFSPDARILILLREPTEMLHSLYCYYRFDGNEFLPSFAEALAAEADRQAGRRLGRQTYFAQGLAYRRAARFTEQVQRYFEVFGRDRVKVILYDDFAAAPAAVCRETLEFLELDPGALKTEFAVVNGARRVRSPLVKAVLGDPLLRSAALAVRPWLPRAVFTAMQRLEASLRRSNARVEPRPCLDPHLRDQLRAEFTPEIESLGRLLGRDLATWSVVERPSARPPGLPVWLPTEVYAGN